MADKQPNHYLKIIGERFAFRIAPDSLQFLKEDNGIMWFTFNRIARNGAVNPIQCPASAIAYLEATYGGTEAVQEGE